MKPLCFVVFGDDWGAHPSSVQHLFRRIAQTSKTLWVNTLGLRPPRIDRADAARVLRKIRTWGNARTNVSNTNEFKGLDLHVIAPPMVPWMRPDVLRQVNRVSVRAMIQRATTKLGMHNPVVVTTVPNGVDGAGIAGSDTLVYYCVDDFTAWPGVDHQAAQTLEYELLNRCNLVVATSDRLVETRRCSHGPTELLAHGVDVSHLGRASDTSTVALEGIKRNKPVLGYLGLLDARLDVDLVVAVARARPDWDVVLVGPSDATPDARLSLPNIRRVGAVAYERVPEALAAFDVAMLPYVRNELTRSINPLKLREYLASGKPVVATSLPEVARFSPEIHVADDVHTFVAAVEQCLTGPRDRREARSALLASESWDARAKRFYSLCERAHNKS
jgi:glycosyltransferase involved in cell wall biosynthesis